MSTPGAKFQANASFTVKNLITYEDCKAQMSLMLSGGGEMSLETFLAGS